MREPIMEKTLPVRKHAPLPLLIKESCFVKLKVQGILKHIQKENCGKVPPKETRAYHPNDQTINANRDKSDNSHRYICRNLHQNPLFHTSHLLQKGPKNLVKEKYIKTALAYCNFNANC